jgi:hypothetical protein
MRRGECAEGRGDKIAGRRGSDSRGGCGGPRPGMRGGEASPIFMPGKDRIPRLGIEPSKRDPRPPNRGKGDRFAPSQADLAPCRWSCRPPESRVLKLRCFSREVTENSPNIGFCGLTQRCTDAKVFPHSASLRLCVRTKAFEILMVSSALPGIARLHNARARASIEHPLEKRVDPAPCSPGCRIDSATFPPAPRGLTRTRGNSILVSSSRTTRDRVSSRIGGPTKLALEQPCDVEDGRQPHNTGICLRGQP